MGFWLCTTINSEMAPPIPARALQFVNPAIRSLLLVTPEMGSHLFRIFQCVESLGDWERWKTRKDPIHAAQLIEYAMRKNSTVRKSLNRVLFTTRATSLPNGGLHCPNHLYKLERESTS
ncbi:MAG: hypothetical protein DMG72_24495 [Acidobacteria bacterium]|nr:MAG: hypothetical protein DMG72_24495 [Acidobacteriota bacterium]